MYCGRSRVGARLLDGLQSGFPSIRAVMADAGYESGKLASKARYRRLAMCSRPGVCAGIAPRADHLPGLAVPLRRLAILCRWAEPHYLTSYGLMPARHGGSL
jgi:hypothetical protein